MSAKKRNDVLNGEKQIKKERKLEHTEDKRSELYKRCYAK